MICDEIFGEENFIEIFSWQKTSTPPNLSKKTKKSVEYILCYQKNECKTLKGLVKESKSTNGLMNQSNSIGTLVFPHESVETSIKNEKLEKGIYGTESYVIELLNDVEIRNGKFLNDIILKGKFKWSQDYLEEQIKLGTKIFIKTKALSPSYEKEEYDPEKPWNIIDRNFGVGTNENASDELDNLFYKNFSDKLYPKPTSLITYLLNMLELENNIILDFFSGSATTAHAVMQLNAEDDGNRKYIMVQLPEKTYKEKLNKKDEIKIVETPAYKAGYKTIDEIGIERIKRAAKKIKEETQAEIDYGFKIVKLETPNSNTLDKIVDFNPDDKKLILDNFIDEFKFGETEGYDTILTTWLNQDGYGMNVKSQKVLLKNFEIDVFENSAYVIKEGISSEDVMELITRVEKNEIAITRLVVYPYSVSFNVLHEMKKNFKNLRGNKELKLIERY